jgi:hypothetical protein
MKTRTVIGKPLPKRPVDKAKTVIGKPDLGDGNAEAIAQRYADKGVTGAAQLKAVEREMRSDPEFSRMIAE